MAKKKADAKTKGNGKPDNGVPWFITKTDRARLVHKGDHALEEFPDVENVVAPIEECKISSGKRPTIFHVRSLNRQERIKIQAFMAQSVMDGTSGQQVVLLIDEAARLAVERVEMPDGEIFDHAYWESVYEEVDGGIAGALGSWIVAQTHKDPLA